MGYDKSPWVFRGRALYQLSLVKVEEARKYVPEELKLVEFNGYTLGGFYLARYDDSPVGAFEELVALGGLVWNAPTSCAWAARVYVNNQEARDHGKKSVGLPSRLATFREVPHDAATGSGSSSSSSNSSSSNDASRGVSWWWQRPAVDKAKNGSGSAQRAQQHQAGSSPSQASPCGPSLLPVQVVNIDPQRRRQGIGALPVATFSLPLARLPHEFAGPRIRMALPSFSGATSDCPSLLQYSCNLLTNVRVVSPAVVSVPARPGSGRRDDSKGDLSDESMAAVLGGRPLVALAFDDMEMTVHEPERLDLRNLGAAQQQQQQQQRLALSSITSAK